MNGDLHIHSEGKPYAIHFLNNKKEKVLFYFIFIYVFFIIIEKEHALFFIIILYTSFISLENSPFWLGKMDERKGNYFKNIKIDFSLIPNNLVYYSDFYFQVCFTNHKYTKLPFIEGGRIDNYFNMRVCDRYR